jgi:hypothetical protein
MFKPKRKNQTMDWWNIDWDKYSRIFPECDDGSELDKASRIFPENVNKELARGLVDKLLQEQPKLKATPELYALMWRRGMLGGPGRVVTPTLLGGEGAPNVNAPAGNNENRQSAPLKLNYSGQVNVRNQEKPELQDHKDKLGL